MYKNIGDKIKGLSIIITICGIIFSLIAGIIQCTQDEIGFGLLTIFGGSIGSWLGSFLLYGFGQAIDDLDFLAGSLLDKQQDKQQRKQQAEEKKNIQQLATDLRTERYNSAEYVDFRCPLCGEMISYTKGAVNSNEVLGCPECNRGFYTKDIFKVQ